MGFIEYFSVTTVAGAKLYEMIFLYGFLLAGGILCLGVVHRKRWMSALGYAVAVADILCFIVFFFLDMYDSILKRGGSENLWIYGSGVVTGLVLSVCIVSVCAINMAIRRFKSDKRYSL